VNVLMVKRCLKHEKDIIRSSLVHGHNNRYLCLIMWIDRTFDSKSAVGDGSGLETVWGKFIISG
jgi:hypothetical protein